MIGAAKESSISGKAPTGRRTRYGNAPTIMDVSRETGLSKSTVSRVLTGSSRVNAKTREQVLEAMDRLGFRVNQAARSLRTTRSALVGLLVPTINNELFAETAERLDQDLREHGIGLAIAGSGWGLGGDLLALDFFASRQVDALVVSTSDDRDPLVKSRLEQMPCPVILFDRDVRDSAFDVVAIDHKGAIHDALAYLADLGHRRVGFCTIATRTKANRDLLSAYRSGVRRLGLDADKVLIAQEPPADDGAGARALGSVLAAGPTAVITAGPLTFSGGVLAAVNEHGLRVPEELSLIGYTDRRLAPLTRPPLTTIERPVHEAGRVLAAMLLKRLADLTAPRMVETLPSVLFVRESCGPAPLKPPLPPRRE